MRTCQDHRPTQAHVHCRRRRRMHERAPRSGHGAHGHRQSSSRTNERRRAPRSGHGTKSSSRNKRTPRSGHGTQCSLSRGRNETAPAPRSGHGAQSSSSRGRNEKAPRSGRHDHGSTGGHSACSSSRPAAAPESDNSKVLDSARSGSEASQSDSESDQSEFTGPSQSEDGQSQADDQSEEDHLLDLEEDAFPLFEPSMSLSAEVVHFLSVSSSKGQPLIGTASYEDQQ